MSIRATIRRALFGYGMAKDTGNRERMAAHRETIRSLWPKRNQQSLNNVVKFGR